jgi:hypothetical protein
MTSESGILAVFAILCFPQSPRMVVYVASSDLNPHFAIALSVGLGFKTFYAQLDQHARTFGVKIQSPPRTEKIM